MAENLAPVHSTRRGRLAAAAVGIVCGAGCAFAAAALTLPAYRARGLLEIDPVGEEGGPGRIDPVATGAVLARSQRVARAVVESASWKDLARDPYDVSSFLGALEVVRHPGTDLVEVAFVDRDPGAAKAAVDETLREFLRIADERSAAGANSTEQRLQSERLALEAKMSALARDTMTVSDGLGADAIESRYRFALEQMNTIDGALQRLEIERAVNHTVGERTSASADHVPTESELAAVNPEVARLVARRDEAKQTLAALVETQGLAPRHPQVVAAKEEIESADAAIARETLLVRARIGAAIEEAATRRKMLSDQRDAVRAEIAHLGRKRAQIEALEQERRRLNDALESVKRRADGIDAGPSGPKVRVIEFAERPTSPVSDRRLLHASLAGIAGFGICFGGLLRFTRRA